MSFFKLRSSGILGINSRNADFILKYNPRKFYPLVDNKLLTKRLAQKAGITVPDLLHVVETQRQAKLLPDVLLGFTDFVVKPASGSGGDGILVITEHVKGRYRLSTGELMDKDEMRYHVSNILSGMYSLGGQPDIALVEYRIKFDPIFEKVTFKGVPDIRVIVFLGYPVMSMGRLPTRASSGKANLHQGAVGVGIDIATGVTGRGVLRGETVDEHPDLGNPLAGIRIPEWEKLLVLAAGCYELTGLGYVGVDIAHDATLGPLILELNARPGLNIQLANRTPLLPRLQAIEDLPVRHATAAERVRFAMERFAAPL